MLQLSSSLKSTVLNKGGILVVVPTVIKQGHVSDARDIAEIYTEAFPESVEFFFPRKDPRRLLDLLDLSFQLVFYWGGQAIVAYDEENRLLGYCLYRSQCKPQKRDYLQLFTTSLRLLSKVNPCEVVRLVANKVLIFFTTDRWPNFKAHTATGEILSIAVSPSVQGQGLGSELLELALKELVSEGVALNVRSSNQAGRRMYASAGFQARGCNRDFLGEWLMLIKPAGG